VGAGEDHTCAFKLNSTVWCWGFNGYGQLGNGTTDDEHHPIKVP
jgi:alpha-tubulin suppressor-like RCC1 family protein